MKLSIQDYTIYANQLIIKNIGIEGQKKLKRTKVLIIGAGGLGCTILTYLAVSGIKAIGLIDGDTIEYSNLNRQILYNKYDIKNSKVLTAKKKSN